MLRLWLRSTTESFPRKREPLFMVPAPTEVPAFAGMTRWRLWRR
jgi:hypothetical protein